MRLTYPIKRGRSMLNQGNVFLFSFFLRSSEYFHCTTKDKDNCYYLNSNNKLNKKLLIIILKSILTHLPWKYFKSIFIQHFTITILLPFFFCLIKKKHKIKLLLYENCIINNCTFYN